MPYGERIDDDSTVRATAGSLLVDTWYVWVSSFHLIIEEVCDVTDLTTCVVLLTFHQIQSAKANNKY